MALVETRHEQQAAVIAYANPPLGTMTAAGAQEMFEAVSRRRGRRGRALHHPHRRHAGHLHPPL